ncbi:angiogenin-like [Eublepharis macularius]|uniref:Angiogenin-like n=1 Tax=Eublepharis macularius TaxID=481883 RepID=A0AA97LB13_EUBMA|nr:angiogenin-like [Eublepharis macularius]
MRPLEGAAYFLLLLLVAELLPGFSDGNNPRYENFLNQHRDDPKSSFHGRYCDTLMRSRGLTRPQCKEINTFIHGSKRQIRAVCDRGGVPDGQLQRSLQHFRVTTCTLRGGSTRPPCEYKENTSPRYIVIGCEGGWPVHYDESQIVTTI